MKGAFKHIKENKWRVVIAAVIVLLCFMPVIIDLVTNRHPISYGRGNVAVNLEDRWGEEKAEEIAGSKICQSFVCSQLNVTEITLYEAPGGRIPQSGIRLELYGEEDNVLIDAWEIDNDTIPDGGKIRVLVRNPLKYDLKGKKCLLIVSSIEGGSEEVLRMQYFPHDKYAYGSLNIDGNEIEGDLVMDIMGSKAPADLEISKFFICFYLSVFFVWLVNKLLPGLKSPDGMENGHEKAQEE
ncbi:MAG: hypothetical protein J6X66_01895 [Lachnospiraceae bacterium]|nr:hypothetical protein [Lachnospiraceae bacterium]